MSADGPSPTRAAGVAAAGAAVGAAVAPATRRWWRRAGVRELGLLVLVYVGYALSRLLADDSFGPARDTALTLLGMERVLGLDLEAGLNRWFLGQAEVGLLAAFYYAAAHYVVTLLVLVWLFVRRDRLYRLARQALLGATFIALVGYLLLPTAPPRLLPGYADLMVVHAEAGWWGAAASAPQGLGWMTNQLAAFPSMHAGWALWVALAVQAATAAPLLRGLAWTHAALTAVVVVGTGNHWLLDVLVGWAVVWVAWAATGSSAASRPTVGERSPSAVRAPLPGGESVVG